ncbi:hypothetical protein VTL71DRAFT_11381 [Oculimacula yallundae]|uniref:Uncharacterized protein n=1 Tax=Oculimacula yallundae TaxID=86028 RepID=A0ABR4CRN8_9HELO
MDTLITRVPVPGTAGAPPPYTVESQAGSPTQAVGPEIRRIDTQSTGSISTPIERRLPQAPDFAKVPSFSPLSLATKTEALSSGFPYVVKLLELNITLEQWSLFTSQLLSAARLTAKEDALAWSTGVTTGTLLSPLIIGPLIGYFAGKSLHSRAVKKVVKDKLAQDKGDLRSVLRLWNLGVFAERGLQATLEAPTSTDDVSVDMGPSATQKDIEREAKRVARRFRIVISPYDANSSLDTASNSDQASATSSSLDEVPTPRIHPDWSPVSPESHPGTPVLRQASYTHRQNTGPDPDRESYPGSPVLGQTPSMHRHNTDPDPESPRTEYPREKVHPRNP